MIGSKQETITPVPYRSMWEGIGVREIRTLRHALGPVLRSAAHIGTTATPGGAARPIIDLAVSYTSMAELERLLPGLYQIGYTRTEPLTAPESALCLTRMDREGRFATVQLFLFADGDPAFRDCIAFRDYLLGRPDIAREYAALRRRLAEQYRDDAAAYAEGKRSWILATLRRARLWVWLGKTVTVTVDRPLGSVHPELQDTVYPVNYGFISGMTGGDGEPQDAYIVGVSRPVSRYTGRVVAVIYRLDDEEDKLVVAPAGTVIDQSRILRDTHFIEQHFRVEMEHLFHRSCGMVVSRRRNGRREYLLLRELRSTVWSIPKGHMEYGESEEETAMRELAEEAGLDGRVIPGFRFEFSYPIPPIYSKTLVVFLTESHGKVKIREGEIGEYRWVDLSGAERLLGTRRMMEAIRRADRFFKARRPRRRRKPREDSKAINSPETD